MPAAIGTIPYRYHHCATLPSVTPQPPAHLHGEAVHTHLAAPCLQLSENTAGEGQHRVSHGNEGAWSIPCWGRGESSWLGARQPRTWPQPNRGMRESILGGVPRLTGFVRIIFDRQGSVFGEEGGHVSALEEEGGVPGRLLWGPGWSGHLRRQQENYPSDTFSL